MSLEVFQRQTARYVHNVFHQLVNKVDNAFFQIKVFSRFHYVLLCNL